MIPTCSRILHKIADAGVLPDGYKHSILQSKIFCMELNAKDPFKLSGLGMGQYIEIMKAEYEEAKDNGFSLVAMPFESTCIEDDQGAVVVVDTKVGILTVISCVDSDKFEEMKRIGFPKEIKYVVTCGMVGVNNYQDFVVLKDKILMFSYDGKSACLEFDVKNIGQEAMALIMEDICRSARSFQEEMIYIDGPDSFTVKMSSKESPKKRGKRNKAEKTANFYDKPIYIIRGEQELRSMSKSMSEGSTVSPHIRRGHWRYFWSEKFVNMKGKRIRVNQMYVGKSKFEDRSRIYEVVIRSNRNKDNTIEPQKCRSLGAV